MKVISVFLFLVSVNAWASIDLSSPFDVATGSTNSQVKSFRLIDQWDGSSGFPEIIRQHPLGACQSFALTAFMEYAFYRRTGQVVDLSEKATSYNLLRYMSDEFYDSKTGTYPEGIFRGPPNLGSGISTWMIESLLQSGLWPNGSYSFGDLDAAVGSVNLDIPLYMSVFEKPEKTLAREDYLKKLDEVFFTSPPSRFVFKVPYLDYTSGKVESLNIQSSMELLANVQVTKNSFTQYHNAELAPFFETDWEKNRDQFNTALAGYARQKGLKEELLPMTELKKKIIASLEKRMVVMVAAAVWAGSWPEKDLVYKGGGGHAMVIVGYQKQGDRVFFKLRNSWGKNIGLDGYNIIEDKVLLPNVLEVTVLDVQN